MYAVLLYFLSFIVRKKENVKVFREVNNNELLEIIARAHVSLCVYKKGNSGRNKGKSFFVCLT